MDLYGPINTSWPHSPKQLLPATGTWKWFRKVQPGVSHVNCECFRFGFINKFNVRFNDAKTYLKNTWLLTRSSPLCVVFVAFTFFPLFRSHEQNIIFQVISGAYIDNLMNFTVNQRFGANLKNVFFCKIVLQISCFLKLFCTKKVEKDYLDQHFECAAPKRWSKYTTSITVIVIHASVAFHNSNCHITYFNPNLGSQTNVNVCKKAMELDAKT